MLSRHSKDSQCNRTKGFTLIEIAIVLVIVGLLLGGLLMPLATQVENQRRDETAKALEEIKEALIGYAMINGRFPCPDRDNTPDGVEDPPGGGVNCTGIANKLGVLPWVTLGVTSTDSWGNFFRYRVTETFADTTAGTTCGIPLTAISFALCSSADANLNVRDAAGVNVAANVPVVVVSLGKNGANATSALELENLDPTPPTVDNIFVSTTYSSVAGTEFDDLVVWIPANILSSRMVAAGRLP